MNEERLLSHIEWLRGDHENSNPFLADDIRALLDQRDELLNQNDSLHYSIEVLEGRATNGFTNRS